MIDFFDKLYYKIKPVGKIRRTLCFGIRIIANILIPVQLFFLKKQRTFNDNAIIVSMTSFPARINIVWKVLASLVLQKQENIRIILWLSRTQFPTKESLPKRLLQMEKTGIEIRIMPDDLRSHKKYYYAFQEFPNNLTVTVDDDIYYRSDLISTLMKTHEKYPGCIVCNRASLISFNNVQLQPYREWSKQTVPVEKPSFNIFATSGGGALYPPGSLHKDIFNVEIIKNLCFYADDLWLNFMARLNNTKSIYTGYDSYILTLISSQKISLKKENVDNGGNDLQIKNINDFYKKMYDIDFDINLEK